MFRNFNKYQAFSLIELAIILVIIGLLFAGITGGMSMVRNSTLRSVTVEYREYKKAVDGFKTKYNALPGDYKNVIGNSGAGNENGLIEFINSANPNAAEGLIAWQHLQAEGMIDAILTPSATSVAITNGVLPAQTPEGGLSATIPASKLKNAGWIFDKLNIDGGEVSSIVLTAAISETAEVIPGKYKALTPTPIINPNDALAVDVKIDDGKANSGKVQVGENLASAHNCHIESGYATNQAGPTCSLAFQID